MKKDSSANWKLFQQCGLLWWVNMFLHAFGWAIFLVVDEHGNITDAFPKRCKLRGFSKIEDYDEGYQQLHKFLKENIEDIERETNE